MEITVKPEDVDAFVKDALIKAGIGKMVSEAIAKTFSGYNNPIDEQMKNFVASVARQLITERFSEQIKTAVAAQIEARVTNEMINNVVEVAVQKMAKAAEDRY
jgi:hypothetical protein